jgi:hypothetical protein
MTVWVQAGMSSDSWAGRRWGFIGDLPSESWWSPLLTQVAKEVHTMTTWRAVATGAARTTLGEFAVPDGAADQPHPPPTAPVQPTSQHPR